LQRLTTNLQSAKTQTDMNLASKKLGEFWDVRLSTVEAKIESRLDNGERKRFGDSRQRWRSYRAKEVRFRASFYDGGSIQPLIANTAYSQITEHRVSELESLFVDGLTGRAEPGGAANRRQPIRSETNRAPAAAASGR
jgi:uncharacterized protein YecT (DUF1311 family)